MSIPSDIQSALNSQLVKAVSSSLIAFENVKFVPPSSGIWYQVFFVPSDTPRSAALGATARTRYTGFYQINIVCPRDSGNGPAIAAAEAIRTYFKLGSYCSYSDLFVLIRSYGYTKGFDSENKFVLPVRIFWRADVLN